MHTWEASAQAANRVICGGGRASVGEPKFFWVNTILGNLKSTFRGIMLSDQSICNVIWQNFNIVSIDGLICAV